MLIYLIGLIKRDNFNLEEKMESKTNFFIKLITSIYDIKVFSKYAKEGILRSMLYAILLAFILAVLKVGVTQYQSDNISNHYLFWKNPF